MEEGGELVYFHRVKFDRFSGTRLIIWFLWTRNAYVQHSSAVTTTRGSAVVGSYVTRILVSGIDAGML